MRRVWLAMFVASFGWGTVGVSARVALGEGVTPYRMSAYSSIIAVIALLIFLVGLRRGFPSGRVVWSVGLLMGVTNLAIPTITRNIALQYASAGFLGLMTALIPIITAAIAHFVLPEERMSVWKAVGLVVGFSGVAVLLLSGDSGLTEGGRPIVAGLLGLLSVTSISAGGVYAKHHAGEYDPLDVTGVHFLSGTFLVVIATLAVEGGPVTESGQAWLALVYMALISTVLPMVLYYWMLRRISATYASLAGYVVPVIAVVAGVLVLDEVLAPGILLGGLLILIGVIVADRAERRPRPVTPPAVLD